MHTHSHTLTYARKLVPALGRYQLVRVARMPCNEFVITNSPCSAAVTVFEPTDIVSLTMEIASNFTYAISSAGLTLVTTECEALRKKPEPIMVYVDRSIWERLVLNLLSNAIKYTPRGGEIELAFVVANTSSPKSIEFIVRDTGIGIPADAMAHLFQRFFRVEKHAGNTQGGNPLYRS